MPQSGDLDDRIRRLAKTEAEDAIRAAFRLFDVDLEDSDSVKEVREAWTESVQQRQDRLARRRAIQRSAIEQAIILIAGAVFGGYLWPIIPKVLSALMSK